MPDTPDGDGWWKASDGNWYPPQSAAPAGIAETVDVGPVRRSHKKAWIGVGIGALALILLVGLLGQSPDEDQSTDLASTDATTTSTTSIEVPATITELAPDTTRRPLNTIPDVTVRRPSPPAPVPTAAPATTPAPTAAPAAAPAPTAPRPAPTTTPRPAATTTPPPTTTPFADGEFGSGKKEVGTDIQPGLYRTRKASSGCYWARLRGLSGNFEDIKANDNTNGPAVVEILAEDRAFDSNRCATWTKNVSAITANRSSFGEGTFIVGTDMDPGVYRSSGSGRCYWARLKDFRGELDGIAANDNTNGATIVEIQPGDRGFKSSGCGDWTRS